MNLKANLTPRWALEKGSVRVSASRQSMAAVPAATSCKDEFYSVHFSQVYIIL
jgi:hypothetical protein